MFTHENKIQTRVSAELKKDKVLIPSNVLQITWELPHRVPEVVPQYYNEYMIYLTGLLIKHSFELCYTIKPFRKASFCGDPDQACLLLPSKLVRQIEIGG